MFKLVWLEGRQKFCVAFMSNDGGNKTVNGT